MVRSPAPSCGVAALVGPASMAVTAVGIVGDFNPQNPTHRFTNEALEHLRLSFEWVPTDHVTEQPADRLRGYAGLWIAPASPYRSMDGALAAIRYARERGVPLVGT
jgi:CTP synthase (UTP-ammonia lyase)